MDRENAAIIGLGLLGLGLGIGYAAALATKPPVAAVAPKKLAAIEIPGYRDENGKWHNPRYLNTDGSGYGLNFFLEDTRPVNLTATLI